MTSWREAHRRRVEQLEADATAMLLGALGPVLDSAATRLGQAVVAAANEGEAQASVDDLNIILAEWKAAVDRVVLPYFGGVFHTGADAAEEQLVGIGVAVPAADPEIIDRAAASYLAQASDQFFQLGDETWEAARAELLAGFRAGEGIGKLRARVRDATGLSRAKAEALARTHVIGASNMGADARVAAMGADAPPFKQWLATMDARTRPTHVRADNQVVPRTDPFEVGGHHLAVPGDPTGPAAEVINCRCTVLYLDTAEPVNVDDRQSGGPVGVVDEAAALQAAAGPPQVDSTTGEPHTGGMVALVPEHPEAWTVDGGEPADALHLTLAYLGESADMPPAALSALQAQLEDLAAGTPPLESNVFGTALWNTSGDTPSLNLAVGGDRLQPLHDMVWQLIGRAGVAGGPDQLWSPPANHTPWVAHVCVLYGDPEYGLEPFFGAATAASQLEGPIRFDRLRLAAGGEAFDYPLAGAGAGGVVPADASMPSASQILATNTGAAVEAPAQEDIAVPWEIREGGPDCPFEVVKEGTDERAGCHKTRAEAEQQLAALYAQEDATVAPAPEPLPGEHLRAKMHTQGSTTGDGRTGRMFTDTTYRDTPFAFHWSKASSAHGGQPVVVHVGNVVRVVPATAAGQPDYGFVTLDLASEDGREYGRRSVAGFERWGSIGLDETKPTVTAEWPEPAEGEEADPLGMMFEEPDLLIIEGGRVGELTGVSVPAQADADIEPTPELIQLMAGDAPADTSEEDEPVAPAAHTSPREPEPEQPTMADAVQALTAAAYTITIPELAPAWWFGEPTDVDVSEGAFNLTEDGRIYGALAPLGVNHRAFAKAGRRQEVPTRNVDYARFMGGWAMTQAGRVPAGPVTMDCGHASRFRADHNVAPAHYENSCTVVAKIAVGLSKRLGVVWAAGALEPGVSIDQVSRMLACRLSGDWQPHSDKAGWSELIAALLVPSPGFPMAHAGASATWEGDALVASSVPVRAVGARGRPRLRVNPAAGTVQRVAAATPAEQFRAIKSAVAAGRPVRKGCC